MVHPISSAGIFEIEIESADAPFVIEGSYLAPSRYEDVMRRDGLEMRFVGEHRPLEAYAAALGRSGLLIGDLREPGRAGSAESLPERSHRWLRIPLFLHLRALKLR